MCLIVYESVNKSKIISIMILSGGKT